MHCSYRYKLVEMSLEKLSKCDTNRKKFLSLQWEPNDSTDRWNLREKFRLIASNPKIRRKKEVQRSQESIYRYVDLYDSLFEAIFDKT